MEIDDEYEDDRVTGVVLAIPDPNGLQRSFEGVELARDMTGHFLVYDGGPDAELEHVHDHFADQPARRAARALAGSRRVGGGARSNG